MSDNRSRPAQQQTDYWDVSRKVDETKWASFSFFLLLQTQNKAKPEKCVYPNQEVTTRDSISA